MTNIQVFNNPEFGDVRVVEQNGEPWFVGKDVAEIVGHENPERAIRKYVEDDDKGVTDLVTPGGKQRATVINESGVYSLILSSKLPRAKEFKRWVTAEVLPSIRKHGAYMTETTLEKALTSPDFLIRLATELKQEQEKRIAAEKQIEIDRPKVVFADAVAVADDSILIGELAKLIRQNGVAMGQNKLFSWLRENGYLMKGGESRNLPTQRAMEMNLFKVKERVISNPDGSQLTTRTTKVTGKGQQYFINRFLQAREA